MRPVFSSQLSDITPRLRPERIIDITDNIYVAADELREKLRMLQIAGELDGGLPIVRDGILVGLIPAPDLEFALDGLQSEEDEMCLMAPKDDFSDNGSDDTSVKDPTDFSPYIDAVCGSDLSLSEKYRLISTCATIGTCGAGKALAHGAGLRVLRKVGPTVHVCSSGGTICRSRKSTMLIEAKKCCCR